MTERPFSGIFEGEFEGEATVLTLSQEGSDITGHAEAAETRYRFHGTAEGARAKGSVADAEDSQSARFEAAIDGDELTVKLKRRFPPLSRTFRFRRR